MLRRRPDLPRTFRSPLNRSISARTKKLLIISEVTSQFVYEKKYRSPLWPGGKSGVTIGVGYDMGYVSKEDFKTDWIGLIPNRDIERLSACCEVRGPKCAQLAIRLSDIKIEWSIAERQFESFVKLYMNLVRVTFPGSEELSDECFGALTSLVYNRGNRMDREEGDPIDRRKEMREIRDLIKSKKYSLIPNRLRAMKRIWVGDPDSRGLLDRREAEARLFEIGMKG